MPVQDILAKLEAPGVRAEQLLDECRAPNLTMWTDHPELYPAFVRKLLDQAHFGRALDLAREGEPYLRGDPELQYLLARAAVGGGNPRYGETLLAPALARATGPADLDAKLLVDVISLQGRVFKDRSRYEPALARESAGWYDRAADHPKARDRDDLRYFPLINAATMWRVAGDRDRSRERAAEVVRVLTEATAKEKAGKGDLWPAASLGEALLLLDRYKDSVGWYAKAIEVAITRGELGKLVSIRNNIRILQEAGATADPAFLDKHLGKVVVFTGHLVDSPDRQKNTPEPRFPNHKKLIQAVADAVRQTVTDLNATVGYCSLGSGGDILFAEAMLDRGAELHVVLPFAQHDFLRTSVDFWQPGNDWRSWRERFDQVLTRIGAGTRSSVSYATVEPYLGSGGLYTHTNTVLQGLAVMRGRERCSEPAAVALIDRSSARAAGGTVDFLARWAATGLPSHEIDLAALRAANPGEAPTAPVADTVRTSRVGRPIKAVLFADVAGYSGIPEWVLADFLIAYGDYLRALFQSAVGQPATYANTWGDGLYVVFDRPEDAARFAVELVEPTIGTQPHWPAYDLGKTVPFRVGLHAGPVFELPDLFRGRTEYAGQHVNRAARIEPVTVRGCAYASEPFAALLTMEAGDRFTAEAVGVHSLAKEYDRCPLYRVQRGGVTARPKS